MESSKYMITDQNRYDKEKLVISDSKDFENEINIRVENKTRLSRVLFNKWYIDCFGVTIAKIAIHKSTQFNQNYKYMFDSNTIQKSVKINLQWERKVIQFVKLIHGAVNVKEMSMFFPYSADISRLFRPLRRINTMNLRCLSLNQPKMHLKDLIKLIHQLNWLQTLIFIICKISGGLKYEKVNTKTRFTLRKIEFHYCSFDFELNSLAEFLLQNDSLKQHLWVEWFHGTGKSKVIALNDL